MGHGSGTTRRTVMAGAGGAAVAVAWSAASLVARAQEATPATTPEIGDRDLSGSVVTISHYRMKAGADPAALVAAVRDRFLPIVTAIPGFWEYRLVLTDDGTVTSIRTFLTPEGAAEGNAKAREWAERELADLSELPAFMVVEGRLEVDADGY
jgi:hypothetical protein